MTPPRVLVVDDEEDFLETLVNRLRRRGVHAQGALSGPQALEAMEGEIFDVVVLDVRMPGMDGLEVLKELKNKWPFVEVIMLTGHGSVESGIQGMRLGAFDYVMKPADLEDLLEKISQAQERRALREE
jgi:two-component system OmpR family response regulator